MNLLKTFVLCSALLLMANCNETGGGNNNSNGSLPSNITTLVFTSSSGYVPSSSAYSGALTLNKSAGVYSGTFTYSTGGGTASCSLNISLTTAQAQQLDAYLIAAGYCAKTNDHSATDCGTDTLTVNTSLVIWKNETVGACQSSYNYFCTGGDVIYTYLKGIITGNSDISTCPSTWSAMF